MKKLLLFLVVCLIMFSVGCEKDVITSEPDTSKDSLSDDEYEYEDDGIVDGDEYVDYTLAVSEGTPLRLKQNHEYTFSIAVLKNDVRIVAVTPKVYDWIDVELGNVAYFGQPVYFGDLVWMDRNLGASSADCENDWYNTIGYYYQHGRNVP